MMVEDGEHHYQENLQYMNYEEDDQDAELQKRVKLLVFQAGAGFQSTRKNSATLSTLLRAW